MLKFLFLFAFFSLVVSQTGVNTQINGINNAITNFIVGRNGQNGGMNRENNNDRQNGGMNRENNDDQNGGMNRENGGMNRENNNDGQNGGTRTGNSIGIGLTGASTVDETVRTSGLGRIFGNGRNDRNNGNSPPEESRTGRQFGIWELLPPAEFQNLRSPLDTISLEIDPLLLSLNKLSTSINSVPVKTQLDGLYLQFNGIKEVAVGLSKQISGLLGTEPISGQRTDVITSSRALAEQVFLLIEEIEDVLRIIEINSTFISQTGTIRNLLQTVENTATSVDTIIDSMRRVALRSRASNAVEDSDSQDESDSNLSTGMIIGIVISGVVVVVVIFVVAFASNKPKHEGA